MFGFFSWLKKFAEDISETKLFKATSFLGKCVFGPIVGPMLLSASAFAYGVVYTAKLVDSVVLPLTPFNFTKGNRIISDAYWQEASDFFKQKVNDAAVLSLFPIIGTGKALGQAFSKMSAESGFGNSKDDDNSIAIDEKKVPVNEAFKSKDNLKKVSDIELKKFGPATIIQSPSAANLDNSKQKQSSPTI